MAVRRGAGCGGLSSQCRSWQRGPRGAATLKAGALLVATLACSALMPRNSSLTWVGYSRLPKVSSPPRRSPRHASSAAAVAPAVETVSIEMPAPLDGRIGVAIQGGRRTVSRLSHKDAFDAGWRIGDVIVAVNRVDVADNEAVKAAVKEALAAHAESGTPLHFSVQRKQLPPADLTQSMLRMTPGTGGALTMSMRDLMLTMVQDLPAVLFMDGTMASPKSNLSAGAVKALRESGVAFKAVDCSDEQYNPGTHDAIEAITGEYMLPQLFVGGKLFGNGYKVKELQEAGGLLDALRTAGALFVPESS